VTTTVQLLENARRRGFARLGADRLVEWLRELVEAGVVVETAPDVWELTPAGRVRFIGVGEMRLDPESKETAAATSRRPKASS
jgi:hypothetical protein